MSESIQIMQKKNRETMKQINKDAFKIEKVLGKGTFGKVMLVTKIDT